jgi:hypothetical protein
MFRDSNPRACQEPFIGFPIPFVNLRPLGPVRLARFECSSNNHDNCSI